jgi:hypothetical protein
MTHDWRVIPSYPLYQVNLDGQIRRIDSGRILRPRILKGYFVLNLRKNGRTVAVSVHRAIAEAFIDNAEKKPFINHKNGIRNDNRIDNLEWVTQSENELHKHAVLGVSSPMKDRFGYDHPLSKEVIAVSPSGERMLFGGANEACRHIGMNISQVVRVCLGHRKHARGWSFAYV